MQVGAGSRGEGDNALHYLHCLEQREECQRILTALSRQPVLDTI